MHARMRNPCALLALVLPILCGSAGDPGVLIEVDLERFSLESRDLAANTAGPALRIAAGSPAHPTPIGEFHPRRVVRNPGWRPGPNAQRLGARAQRPSNDGPLGAGKIPLEAGAIQIHGGADPLELGKPVSLGCVALHDQSWLALVDWLRSRDSLEPERATPHGDLVSAFRRPVRVVVR
jgi:L,D-transpeptidase catalytic domain